MDPDPFGPLEIRRPAESPAESPPEEQSPGVAVFQELGITVAFVYFIQEIAEGK